MKTTTDNHIDKLLHEAMKQRAAKVPPLADDFAEKVMGSLTANSLTPRPLREERELKFWPLVVAACMVGFVVIFLAPPKSTEEQQPLALEEPEVVEQPDVAEVVEQPVPETSDKSDKAEPIKPRKVHKPHKLSKFVEDPLLAEAEVNASHLEEVERGAAEDVHPIHPEMNDPYLAIMEQMKDIRSRGERVRQEVAQLIDKH
jgi:hypothetical protein